MVGVDVCRASQSLAADWVTLVIAAHLHLQRAAWVGMLIRCAHLRTNPFEYYNNIWQTSSTKWWTWPTASENYCLARKHGSFDVLHMVDHIQGLSTKSKSLAPQSFSSSWPAPVGYRCVVHPFATYGYFQLSGESRCLTEIQWSHASLGRSKCLLKKFYVENSALYLKQHSLLP